MKHSEEQRASTVPHIYPCDTQQKVHTMEEPSRVPDDLLWVTSASSAVAYCFFSDRGGGDADYARAHQHGLLFPRLV